MVRKLLMSAALVVSAWPFAAHAVWQEASSTHFIVYADDKPERIRTFTESSCNSPMVSTTLRICRAVIRPAGRGAPKPCAASAIRRAAAWDSSTLGIRTLDHVRPTARAGSVQRATICR